MSHTDICSLFERCRSMFDAHIIDIRDGASNINSNATIFFPLQSPYSSRVRHSFGGPSILVPHIHHRKVCKTAKNISAAVQSVTKTRLWYHGLYNIAPHVLLPNLLAALGSNTERHIINSVMSPLLFLPTRERRLQELIPKKTHDLQ